MSNSILLAAPKSQFYERILKEFALGFKEAGVTAYWCCYDNEKEEFYQLANKINPNLILEIDSVVNNKKLLHDDIKHVAWIQDYRYNGRCIIDDFGESDFVYFMINPIVWDVDTTKIKFWSILSPGAPSNKTSTQLVSSGNVDISFLGYIPNPIDMDRLLVCPISNTSVQLKNFLSDFKLKYLFQSTYSKKEIYKSIRNSCIKHNLKWLNDADLHIIDELLPRTIERKLVMDILMKASSSIEIYGSNEWLNWINYREFYKGYAKDFEEVKAVYQNTRVNIHNGGLSMHYRVLECMSVGGFMLINNTQLDSLYGGINSYFQSGVHYGSYELDSLSEVIEYYLNNQGVRDTIRFNGMSEVQAHHTWKDRARQVINDLKLVPDFQVENFIKRVDFDKT